MSGIAIPTTLTYAQRVPYSHAPGPRAAIRSQRLREDDLRPSLWQYRRPSNGSPPGAARCRREDIMGTRTDILKIASKLREIAIKNPSADLMPVVTELEAAAERADKKRLAKKKAVEDLLSALPKGSAMSVGVPKANFLSTVVAPRINDPALKMQIAEYEKSIAGLLQQADRSGHSYAAALGLFRSRWDA
jgi:hypothetical protein